MARKSISPVTFWLRDSQAHKPTPIHCLVCFDNERLKFSIPFKVLPAHWNHEKYRIRNVVDATNKDSANTFMNNLESAITNILNDLRAKRIPLNKETIKQQIDIYLNPVVETGKPKNLLDFVRWYIETCPTRLVRSKGNRAGRVISPNTIRRYKTTLNGLESFALAYTDSLDLDNIDTNFYKAFTEWLTAKNYATNNVSKYIENLKGFMSAAVDEGLTANYAFRKFANMREDAENIYLTELELQRIYELDLSKISRLERVRDLFIFAAWTGLRFSDFSTLQPEHIKIDNDGNKYLDLKQQKTGGRVQIPIVHEAVIQLLAKYDNRLPSGISNQKTNDYLKEICKLAEIDSRELKHVTKGGKQVVKTSDGWAKVSPGVLKWELVTSHTARRSFATNMFKRGMPTLLIMKLTGHRKESEFLKYIKVDAQETMSLIRSYFQK
ncbi:site-specific integrase [Spirosoma panaciterrae]|uniref:site-specific integrase n=1 Tax=Spirosoma panaciterrae TaxID=496058 RepID=UPI00037B6773|nr:site-specific integrase [Spirosoma panaciterrae]